MSLNIILKGISRDFQSRLACFKIRPLVSPVKISIDNKRYYADVWEPAYLDEVTSLIPTYGLINIQCKGYDYPILEKYEQFVHKSAVRFGLDVEDAWGIPAKKMKITRLKPESTIVEAEYELNLYERNVQLADVPSISLPLFINFIEAALPAGVNFSVHPHEPEHTELRYIPDYKLLELKGELEDMRNPSQLTKKKVGFQPKKKRVAKNVKPIIDI